MAGFFSHLQVLCQRQPSEDRGSLYALNIIIEDDVCEDLCACSHKGINNQLWKEFDWKLKIWYFNPTFVISLYVKECLVAFCWSNCVKIGDHTRLLGLSSNSFFLAVSEFDKSSGFPPINENHFFKKWVSTRQKCFLFVIVSNRWNMVLLLAFYLLLDWRKKITRVINKMMQWISQSRKWITAEIKQNKI